ncbi:MAG: hypothetical protein ACUVR8_11580, partial [Acidobacteriota bacterium]
VAQIGLLAAVCGVSALPADIFPEVRQAFPRPRETSFDVEGDCSSDCSSSCGGDGCGSSCGGGCGGGCS